MLRLFFDFIGNFIISYKAKTLRCGCARFCRGKGRMDAMQKRRESFAGETLCSTKMNGFLFTMP